MALKLFNSLEELLKIKHVENSFREGRFLEIVNTIRNPNSKEEILLENINQINYIVAKPNEIGGNHYHNFKREKIVVLEGKALIVIEDPKTCEQYKTTIMAGHMFTFEPKIAHAITSASEEAVRYLEITNKAFDPNNPKEDVYIYKINF